MKFGSMFKRTKDSNMKQILNNYSYNFRKNGKIPEPVAPRVDVSAKPMHAKTIIAI